MRQRGLSWLHRHGHLDDDALHVLDSLDHAGGWSVDASATIPRCAARPPTDGRTKLLLTPIDLLDLLSQLVTPPRLHKHRYCGVLAPNSRSGSTRLSPRALRSRERREFGSNGAIVGGWGRVIDRRGAIVPQSMGVERRDGGENGWLFFLFSTCI